MGTILSWSGGKDSAYALATLQAQGEEVAGLLTTVTETYDRVSIHGVRRSLLRRQAEEAGLPLYEVVLPVPCSNEEYEARMGAKVRELVAGGVTSFAFGDLYLEDVRRYREAMLAQIGDDRPRVLFPLWGRPTGELAHQILRDGFQAVVTCVDPRQVDASLVGREYDARFLADLPASADPCGENGEFHTFVYDAPVFARPIALRRGPSVTRDGFCYYDLEEAAGQTS